MDAVHHSVGGVEFGDGGLAQGDGSGVVAVVHRALIPFAGGRRIIARPFLNQRNQAEFAQVGKSHCRDTARKVGDWGLEMRMRRV